MNGSFETTTLTGKDRFAGNVPGWDGGTRLTFLDFPGTADDGSYLSVYKGFPRVSPDGGNFVEADGDPNYSGVISQTIRNLQIGDRYEVDFYQAAAQQVNFTGGTTERWKVSLGSDSQLSTKFSLPQAGVGAWQAQSLFFIANAATEVLSFLAMGTPNGAPPISFLDGVSMTDVPEPVSLSLLAAGLIGAVAVRRKALHRAS